MLIQTSFNAKPVVSFEKEFDNNGQKVKYYNLAVMTDEGVTTLKCNKDVHESLVSGKIVPMRPYLFSAVFDPDKRDFRVVLVGDKPLHSANK